MIRTEFLKASPSTLQTWLKTFHAAVEGHTHLSSKMKAYLLRNMNNDAIKSTDAFLKKRSSIVLYLNDSSDFTESTHYTDEEIKMAVDLLLPDDFHHDRDCPYCLKEVGSPEELQKHFEVCTA